MTSDTGGNVVIPGSHIIRKKIPGLYTDRLAKIPEQVGHFRFPNNDPQLADSNPITCYMKAGDLLL